MATQRIIFALGGLALVGIVIVVLLWPSSSTAPGQGAIAAGGHHSCALSERGGVQCWGLNSTGQLGNGTTTNSAEPVPAVGLAAGIAAVDLGGLHTCALSDAGAVQCWGWNEFGQLGNGSSGADSSANAPVEVDGLASDVKAISLGAEHSCALRSDGVVCWGRNDDGRLGDGTTTHRSTLVSIAGLESSIEAIAAGSLHSCALKTDGGVVCWGNNSSGQLGDGTMTNSLTPVEVSGLPGDVKALAAGAQHTCALTIDDQIWCWGGNDFGQLGDGTTESRTTPLPVGGLPDAPVVVLTAGFRHTCALTSSAGISCWGGNSSGQVGDGTTTDLALPAAVVDLTTDVAAVEAGGFHTCALSDDGVVMCWGESRESQVGTAATDLCGTPPGTYRCSTTPIVVLAVGR